MTPITAIRSSNFRSVPLAQTLWIGAFRAASVSGAIDEPIGEHNAWILLKLLNGCDVRLSTNPTTAAYLAGLTWSKAMWLLATYDVKKLGFPWASQLEKMIVKQFGS